MNLLEFAEQMVTLVVEEEAANRVILEEVAKIVEKESKNSIGHYQDQAGQFVAWAELTDATKADRIAKGYSPDEPLLRDGTMRDSIQHTVTGNEAHIGSDDKIAEYQELGTHHIPPRSFLGGAAFRKEPEIIELIGGETFAFLCGNGVVNGIMKI